MPEALIYTRVSTEEQARSGLGLEDQEERCRAYCVMRGLRIAEVVTDAGVSAGKPLRSREGGSRLLSATGSVRPRIRHVVVLKLDRAFRNAADCLKVTEDWDKRGVVFHVVDMGGASLDLSTAMGRCFLSMAAAFAELERGLISERTKAAARRTKARGQAWGKMIPFGYRLGEDSKALQPCEDEQDVIRIVRECREGGYTYREIVAELREQGKVGRTGRPLGLTQVARIARKVKRSA